MTERIVIPAWPTTLDAVAWSTDNVIAVAAGDSFAIVSPTRPRISGDARWDVTMVQANAFTHQEVPRIDPLSFDNFSIGEELSFRHVQRLQWSHSGLGKNARCVLGVLSSNHVLSLWECHGKLDNAGDWRRSVVVNHAVTRRFKNRPSERQPDEETLQVYQRIRCFAWAGAFLYPGLNNSSPVNGWSSLIAVGVSSGQILIVGIRSPNGL